MRPIRWKRTIALVHMNAFFASVEMRDYPELRRRPVAVTSQCVTVRLCHQIPDGELTLAPALFWRSLKIMCGGVEYTWQGNVMRIYFPTLKARLPAHKKTTTKSPANAGLFSGLTNFIQAGYDQSSLVRISYFCCSSSLLSSCSGSTRMQSTGQTSMHWGSS